MDFELHRVEHDTLPGAFTTLGVRQLEATRLPV